MSTSSRELILYGAGGLGREICALTTLGCRSDYDAPFWAVAGYVDDTLGAKGKIVHGRPVLGSLEEVAAQRKGQETWCYIAMGNNEERMKAAKRIKAYGWKAASIFSPSCLIAADAWFGEGCYVGLGVTVSPATKIGRYVILNTRSSVGHDTKLGSFSQMSLGASLLGGSSIGQGALIGAHAVVMSGVSVGAWATVGVATPALKDVQAGDTICLPLPKVLFKRKSMPETDPED